MARKPASSARKAPAKARVAPKPGGAPVRALKVPPKAVAKAPEPAKKPVAKAPAAAAKPVPVGQAAPGAALPAKLLKKAAPKAKKPAVPRAAPRLKIVWAVCDHTLKTLKTFPYPERRAAEIEASRLQKSKGKEHLVRAERVPMTQQPEARR